MTVDAIGAAEGETRTETLERMGVGGAGANVKPHTWVTEERDGVIDWYDHTECKTCGAGLGHDKSFAFMPNTGGHCRVSPTDCDLAQAEAVAWRKKRALAAAEEAAEKARRKAMPKRVSAAVFCCVVLPDLIKILRPPRSWGPPPLHNQDKMDEALDRLRTMTLEEFTALRDVGIARRFGT